MTQTLNRPKPPAKKEAPTVTKPDAASLRGRPQQPRHAEPLESEVPSPATVSEDQPRRIGALRISDVLAMVGAVVVAIALTSTIYSFLAPVGGVVGYFATAYVLFLLAYGILVSLDESMPTVRARVISVAIHSLAVTVFVTLVFVVLFATIRGLEALPHWNFFSQDMSLAGPLDPLSTGGIIHAITGTLIQIGIALAITIPLGITTAVFLNEIPGAFSRFVRTIVEAMTALPSIVAGLFIYATFILMFGLGKSGFAASLAISVMMLPIMIRAADVVLRLVPSTLKEASLGLGANNWHTMWHVTLPTARSGLVTAIILATARGIGETSPVLLTSGFTAAFNADPLHGPMVSLPLAIFQFVKSPEPTMIARGFGTAAVLMALVVTLFIIARIIGGQTVAKKEKSRERRAQMWADATLFFTSIGAEVAKAWKNSAQGAVAGAKNVAAGAKSVTAPRATQDRPDASASGARRVTTRRQASESNSESSERRQAKAVDDEAARRLRLAMGKQKPKSGTSSFEEYLEMFPEPNKKKDPDKS